MANPAHILLELWAIDQNRRKLRLEREDRIKRLAVAEKTAQDKRAEAAKAAAAVDSTGALVRQYSADSARCDERIAALRAQQGSAKTNKEYMGIINGIEEAKVEKANRESSVKDLTSRIDALKATAAAAEAAAAAAEAALAAAKTAVGDTTATPEELALDQDYAAKRVHLEPAFLEAYERLVKSNHKNPLVRVDPVTRATPYGQLLSHNQLEQVRMNKLVIDRTSNGIYYLP